MAKLQSGELKAKRAVATRLDKEYLDKIEQLSETDKRYALKLADAFNKCDRLERQESDILLCLQVMADAVLTSDSVGAALNMSSVISELKALSLENITELSEEKKDIISYLKCLIEPDNEEEVDSFEKRKKAREKEIERYYARVQLDNQIERRNRAMSEAFSNNFDIGLKNLSATDEKNDQSDNKYFEVEYDPYMDLLINKIDGESDVDELVELNIEGPNFETRFWAYWLILADNKEMGSKMFQEANQKSYENVLTALKEVNDCYSAGEDNTPKMTDAKNKLVKYCKAYIDNHEGRKTKSGVERISLINGLKHMCNESLSEISKDQKHELTNAKELQSEEDAAKAARTNKKEAKAAEAPQKQDVLKPEVAELKSPELKRK